jgi:hypothetical protein
MFEDDPGALDSYQRARKSHPEAAASFEKWPQGPPFQTAEERAAWLKERSVRQPGKVARKSADFFAYT